MNEEEEFNKLEALKSIPGVAWQGLQQVGEGMDWTNEQVNLRNALRMNPANMIGSAVTGQDRFSEENTPDWLDNILDYSYKDARDDISGGAGWAAEKLTGSKAVGQGAELLGQVLLPDAVDFATGGVGYLDNLARVPKAIKNISAKDGQRILDDVWKTSDNRFKPQLATAGGPSGAFDEVTDTSMMMSKGSGSSVQGTLPLSSGYNLVDSLKRNQGLSNFLTGKSSRLGNRDYAGLMQDPRFNRLDFYDQQELIKSSLNELYPNYKGPKVDDRVQKLLWSFHHENPLKYGPDLYKGKELGLPKTDPNSTEWVTDILEKKGVGAGWNPMNRQVLTPQQHWILHEWLGKRLGERGDVLKVKWADRFGVKLSGGTSAKDVMGNYVHQALSSADRKLFNDAYAAADPKLQKAYISAWGDTIIESRKIIKDLRDQLDILFRVPDGYKLQLGDKDWHDILDGMPTRDGNTILPEMKEHIEFMIKEGAIDQPLKVINPKGVVVETIDTSSMEWKEMQSLTELLKDTKLSKHMRNKYRKERQRLHNKLYQTNLDLKGAERAGIRAARIAEEELRRQGK